MSSSSCCEKVLPSDEGIIRAVNEAYSRQAREGVDTTHAERVANAFGYTAEELQSIPAESHMGLSCGNPVAQASIKEGETVLDLGSGGGIDVFLAAAKVGPAGQVIGLDMSDDMISLARRNAVTKGLKPPSVAFVKASLTGDLPVQDDSIDCVLSNCVINLLPPTGKLNLVKEIYRVLKPGGRVVLDDIIAQKPFPDSLRSNMAAYIGCISGAILLKEYQELMENANFKEMLFTENRTDLNIYNQDSFTGCCATQTSNCCTPEKPTTSAPADIGDLNQWAKSYLIYARKSDAPTTPHSVLDSALKNWWDAYPTPSSSPDALECGQVAGLIRDSDSSKQSFVVVDVRRNDHGGGHVRGSIQRPAQTFYDDLPKFYEEHKETEQVIFYCGSSNGRGPRCAKWYQDYLNQQENNRSKAFIMAGGVNKWLSSYKEQEDLVDFD
ncbi:S-adenosyl-L-methionine-dependent methyltransferase [Melanogaster broomeanus]|nr:S-adenosyl-L-methionine-dependent methyltransferase [Melanogaster broomeanus]